MSNLKVDSIQVGADVTTQQVGSNLNGAIEPETYNVMYACQTQGPGTLMLDKVLNENQGGGSFDGAGVITRKARGVPGALQNVGSTEQLGYMDFRAYSGNIFWQVCSIAAYVDGTFASGQAPPTRLSFFASVLNGTANEVVRMRGDGATFNYGPFFVNANGPLIGANPYLTVQGTSNDWTGVFYSAPSSGFCYGLRAHTVGTTSSSYPFAVSSGSGAGTIRFAVLGNGNVGVGTATPSAQLHTTGSVRLANFGAGTLHTDANGNVSASSDARLKDIKSAFTRGLAAIEVIVPIMYRWKEETGLDAQRDYVGLSAQNVQAAIPEAVGRGPDEYLTLTDRALIAALINSVKEIAARLDKLETLPATA